MVKARTLQSSAETMDAACCASLMRGRLPGLRASSARTPQAPRTKPANPLRAAEHKALGEKLSNQASAAGADGGADGDLSLPRGRAREQQSSRHWRRRSTARS